MSTNRDSALHEVQQCSNTIKADSGNGKAYSQHNCKKQRRTFSSLWFWFDPFRCSGRHCYHISIRTPFVLESPPPKTASCMVTDAVLDYRLSSNLFNFPIIQLFHILKLISCLQALSASSPPLHCCIPATIYEILIRSMKRVSKN